MIFIDDKITGTHNTTAICCLDSLMENTKFQLDISKNKGTTA